MIKETLKLIRRSLCLCSNPHMAQKSLLECGVEMVIDEALLQAGGGRKRLSGECAEKRLYHVVSFKKFLIF